jgi:phosphohistidine phosphatase
VPTLILVRHAKAEPHAGDDHARRLVERGRVQAVELGAWLRAQGVAPDRVVVSTAARARETWEGTGLGGPVELADDAYDATTEDLRAIVAGTDVSVRTLVLVGHNPGMERLAWELDDSQVARDLTNRGMSTAGAVVVELDAWDAPCGTVRAVRG